MILHVTFDFQKCSQQIYLEGRQKRKRQVHVNETYLRNVFNFCLGYPIKLGLWQRTLS